MSIFYEIFFISFNKNYNDIILTDRGPPNSLARKLYHEWDRKSKEIENEERILKEREQELENRKQRLKSISSKSSSDSDLSKNTKNTSATNTILDNDSNDEIPLKDVEQHSLYNESSLYPDTAVQSILSQGLSSISSHHLQSSVDSASNSSTINDEIIRQQQQNQQHLLQRQILDLPDNSRFLSPNPSEDAWSEIGSIISEDVGSEMSSAVDIDMEETQILIWAQPVLIPFFMIHSVRLTYILIEEQRKKQEREAAQAALIAKSLSIIEEDETDDEESEAGDTDMEELLAKQFDLYVRDATKYGGFFKQTQSYLMYPFVEKRKRYDDYGEIIPSDMFKRVGGSIGTEGIGIEPIGDRDDMGGGDKEEFDKDNNNSSLDSNVPTKYVLYDEDVTFKCQIRFIDLEGTNDGRSLKTIVPQVQPRKLIVVHASQEATKDFAQSCLALESMTKDIYTPDVGETLNVSAAINFYQVKLTDSLISSLNFSKLEDYDIAFITGKISFPQDYSLPILDAIPIEENTSNNNPIFVGEVKLSELKRLLQSEGITAEFKGEGVLVCNEKVAIKKTSKGQLILEGSLSEDYYKIRTIIYAQHALL
ncbi:2211_t:CDS:2 [Entrophospora sp. SA101]|nr:2211_t:CDS:2 [Entrophospora sp. SA101]